MLFCLIFLAYSHIGRMFMLAEAVCSFLASDCIFLFSHFCAFALCGVVSVAFPHYFPSSSSFCISIYLDSLCCFEIGWILV